MNSIASRIFIFQKDAKRLMIQKKSSKSDNSNVVMSKDINIFCYKGVLVLFEKMF